MTVTIRCVFCQHVFWWPANELWPNPCPRCGRHNGLSMEPDQ